MGDSLASHFQFCVLVILIILFVMYMHKIFLGFFWGELGEVLSPLLLHFLGSVGFHSVGKDLLLELLVLIASPTYKGLGHSSSVFKSESFSRNRRYSCMLLSAAV